MDKFKKIYDDLKEDIIDTKETRIRAYKRCLYWNSLLNIMNNVYASIVVLLSILLLTYSSESLIIQYGLICLSIVSLVFSLIVNNADYEGKYHDYKDSFNRLEALLSEMKYIDYTEDSLKVIENKYNNELSSSINHKSCDYNQYKMDTLYRCKFDELSDNEKTKLIERNKEIVRNYRKDKSKEFVCKIAVTLGLYAIYALFYYLVLLVKLIFVKKYRKPKID